MKILDFDVAIVQTLAGETVLSCRKVYETDTPYGPTIVDTGYQPVPTLTEKAPEEAGEVVEEEAVVEQQ